MKTIWTIILTLSLTANLVTAQDTLYVYKAGAMIYKQAVTGVDSITFTKNVFPTQGLVAWYPFNGNANDESGNGNNGTVDGATLTTDRFGLINNAFRFDGISNYISLSNSFFNGNTAVSQLTYSIWIKCSKPISLPFSISNKEGFWRSIGLGLQTDGSINFGGSQPSPQGYFNIQSAQNVIIYNNWQNIVVTFNSGVLTMYLNGSKIATNNTSYTSLNYSYYTTGNSTATNLIGAAQPATGLTDFFNGYIDDFGIWNRELTQEEITTIYNYK